MKNLKIITLVILSLWAGGCTGLLVPKEDQLLPAGRYSELETYVSGRIKDMSSASTSQLMYLCYAYSRLKKYNKLFPCIEQMERNIEKGDRTANMFDMSAVPYLLRAEALLDFGNYPKAVDEARRAYDVVQQRDLARIMRIYALSALGLAHALNGEHEKAKAEASLLQEIGTHYPFTFLKTDKLNGLARIYMALGDFQHSLDLIREDESIAWFRGFTEFATVAILAMPPGDSVFAFAQLPKLFILNKSLYETGHTKEAKAGYDRLLEKPQTKDNGDIYWMILRDRGKIAAGEGNQQEAAEFYKRAIDVIERQRSSINTETSKIGFVGNKQEVYHLLIAELFAMGKYASAFEYVERSKSRALVDLLAAKKDFAVSNESGKQAASLVKELDGQEADAKIQETADAAKQASVRSAHYIETKEKLRALEPELSSLVTVTPVASQDIQSLLATDESLIEYYYYGDDVYVFVLSRAAVHAARLDGVNLMQDTEHFRAALADTLSQRFRGASQKLHHRLIEPIEPWLTTNTLILVPHGVLHYLPFAALQNGAEYVIDRYSIRVLPSASVMQYLKNGKSLSSASLLVFGNPDLGNPSGDLKFAQDEAVSIAKEFAESKVLLRKQATKTALMTLGKQFQYLHFATHGKFDPDAPLDSGLLLSSDAGRDGTLRVGDLYTLRLNAFLVTLSACETGLGKVNNGDDVVGLVRGFLFAGTESIVASLWQVDDRATSYLMTQFYGNLKHLNKREALRQAELSTKKQYQHPFFWAAFQLTGRAD